MSAETDRVKEDTEGARSQRIRDELEFLGRHGIQFSPAVRDGKLVGIYVQALPSAVDAPRDVDVLGRVTISVQPAPTVGGVDVAAPGAMEQGTVTVDAVPIPVLLAMNEEDK
jgi:hypothetical protein